MTDTSKEDRMIRNKGAICGLAIGMSVVALFTLPQIIFNGQVCIATENRFMTFLELVIILVTTIVLLKKVW